MIAKDKLDDAFRLVNNFKSMDLKSGIFNTFPLNHYRVPKMDGIHNRVQGKGINQVKPSTLEYIIFNLHNADEDMIIEAIIVLLYYYKIKKKDNKTMMKVYKSILHHFTIANKEERVLFDIDDEAIVYSISFYIGSIRINKFGYTTDKERLIKLLSDIKLKYPHVSVGNLIVNQTIQFETKEQAKKYEEVALSSMKQHKSYQKSKNCFDGYKEAYLHL